MCLTHIPGFCLIDQFFHAYHKPGGVLQGRIDAFESCCSDMFYISVTLSDAKPRVKALSTIGLHLWQLASSIDGSMLH